MMISPFVRVLSVLVGVGLAVVSIEAQITLPEPLAIEIPVEGQTTINAADSPLVELLEAATSSQGAATHDRQGYDFPLGPTSVTWSDGFTNVSAFVYVYPFGQTPVGSTDYERATAGNGATNVVRDGDGKIHIGWLDSGRGNDRVMYRRGVQDPDTGAIAWETAALPISEPGNSAYNSMVGLAVSEGFVHFVWYGGGNNTYYRRLRLSDYGFDPVRGTGAEGSLSNNGPTIAVRGDEEIHITTPANSSSGGQYALSVDGGASWTVEDIPRPGSGNMMKATAVDVDRHGNAHVVFPWRVRNSGGRFWQLRYIRRTSGGSWEDGQSVLARFPAWQDPQADADPSNDGWDIVEDWLDIAVDANDDIHIAWHGTANTHRFAEDEAFYIRRAATADAVWASEWDDYVLLWPAVDGFSFAPSITVHPETRVAIPVVFYDTSNSEIFDSHFKFMRSGVWDGVPPLPLTTMGADGNGLSSWFPCTSPAFYVHPNGRVWLDSLATDFPAESSSDMIIVLQRREVTAELLGRPILTVNRDSLGWTTTSGVTAYDVVGGDLTTLRQTGGDFTSATDDCVAEDSSSTALDYSITPDPGDGRWFLVRGVDGDGGLTYDTLQPGQVETRDEEIALAPQACF